MVKGMFPGTNPSTHFIATFQTHLAQGYYTFGDGHSFSQHWAFLTGKAIQQIGRLYSEKAKHYSFHFLFLEKVSKHPRWISNFSLVEGGRWWCWWYWWWWWGVLEKGILEHCWAAKTDRALSFILLDQNGQTQVYRLISGPQKVR